MVPGFPDDAFLSPWLLKVLRAFGCAIVEELANQYRVIATCCSEAGNDQCEQSGAEVVRRDLTLHAGQVGVDALDRRVRLVDVHLDDEFELIVVGHGDKNPEEVSGADLSGGGEPFRDMRFGKAGGS